MTWFWFMLFGIIGLTKRKQIADHLTNWSTEALHKAAWTGLVFWGIMGLFMLPFNEGKMPLMHILGGFSGVLGFFSLSAYLSRNAQANANQRREQTEAIRRRLEATNVPDPEDDQHHVQLDRKDTRQPNAEVRLLDIMSKMAEQNAAADHLELSVGDQAGVDEQLSPAGPAAAEVSSDLPDEPVVSSPREFTIDLGTTSVFSGSQQIETAVVQATAPVAEDRAALPVAGDDAGGDTCMAEEPASEGDPGPALEPAPAGVPVAAVEPLDEPGAELEAEPAAEPEMEPEAVPVPLPPGPVPRGGYQPGPIRLGGVPRVLSTEPVTPGKPEPGRVAPPAPRKPGFIYQPKLINSVLGAGRPAIRAVPEDVAE